MNNTSKYPKKHGAKLRVVEVTEEKIINLTFCGIRV
jgi:hypothetical protein